MVLVQSQTEILLFDTHFSEFLFQRTVSYLL